MADCFGRYLRVTTFGESHGPAVGAVVEGLPAGLEVSLDEIRRLMDRRRPGASDLVSSRNEPDRVEVLSGVESGRTIGSPVALLIRNLDARPEEYRRTRKLFRPGHADFTWFEKFGRMPPSGGGRLSGRETAARVAAGALAMSFMASLGMKVRGYTLSVGPVSCRKVVPEFAEQHPLRCADPDVASEMTDVVRKASSSGDSVGGRIEVVAEGVPAGLGEPVFGKLDALLAGAMVSVGGVKGVEIGEGFRLCRLKGSEANDQMSREGFLSNRCGGTLGGISTGRPIVVRLAVKPTPSISNRQRTTGPDGEDADLEIHGRHDPCLCPRVVAVAEAMAALVIADAAIAQRTRNMDGYYYFFGPRARNGPPGV
ncbi:chorismate synthase [Candidatus Fermentibacteria bacterium]|nr:chorismate synthase [Candidatus Fermentibacteria bacterium]